MMKTTVLVFISLLVICSATYDGYIYENSHQYEGYEDAEASKQSRHPLRQQNDGYDQQGQGLQDEQGYNDPVQKYRQDEDNEDTVDHSPKQSRHTPRRKKTRQDDAYHDQQGQGLQDEYGYNNPVQKHPQDEDNEDSVDHSSKQSRRIRDQRQKNRQNDFYQSQRRQGLQDKNSYNGPQPAIVQGITSVHKNLATLHHEIFNSFSNQVDNIFDNLGDIVKGTDRVLTENSKQFKRINAANAKFLTQAAKTKGTTIAKIPNAGTSVLSVAEEFIEEPGSFFKNLSPLSIIKNTLGIKPSTEEELAKLAKAIIKASLADMETQDPDLFDNLTSKKYIYEWLNNHPDIFLVLLKDQQSLETVLENPPILHAMAQEINQAKYQ